MDQAAGQDGGSRSSRARAISLEQASPERMEARPGTAIRLSAAQGEQLEEIVRGAGRRFQRRGIEASPRPAART